MVAQKKIRIESEVVVALAPEIADCLMEEVRVVLPPAVPVRVVLPPAVVEAVVVVGVNNAVDRQDR
ncbi:MAG: hypothetical protein ACRCSF_05145 [Mycobacteriaceae bacterium]